MCSNNLSGPTVPFIVWIIAACCIWGCSSRDEAIRTRVVSEQKRVESELSTAKGELQRNLALKMFGALHSATSSSLAQPTLVYAILFETNDKYLLNVHWIESSPTVSDVMFRFNEHDSWSVSPIPEVDSKYNRESVLPNGGLEFQAVIEMPKNTDATRELDTLDSREAVVEVKLRFGRSLDSNTVVANWQDNRKLESIHEP